MDTKVGSSWSRKAGMPPQATEYLLQTRRAAPKQSKTRGCGASEHQQSRKSCRWAWRYRARKKQGGTEFHVRCSTIHYALMMACSSAQLQIYLLTIKQKTCILPYVICHNLHTAAIDSAWAREVRTHHHPPYFITTCTCTFGSAPKYRIAAATHASCMTRADTTLFFPSASGVLQSTISSRCCTLHVSTVTVRHLWHPC